MVFKKTETRGGYWLSPPVFLLLDRLVQHQGH